MMNYLDVTSPNYSYIFDFESEFSPASTRKWMQDNWTVAFYYVGAYMAFIFWGQAYMQNRPRFELRGILMVWNSCLAAFSIMGATRTLPELVHVLTHYGVYHSVCIPSFIEKDRVCGFWTWMFVLSKLPELGDTVFIVLRKQPLIFLHWYHHITVLLYTWFSYVEFTSSARWFIVMNYCVHSVMYSYYALRSMGYRVPKQLAMTITALQLSQMIVGFVVNLWARDYLAHSHAHNHAPPACHISDLNIKLSMAMYFSYFVLFAQFFHKSYLSNNDKSKTQAAPASIRMKASVRDEPIRRNGEVAAH